MKFLSNIYDPEKPDAKQMVAYRSDETQEETWQNHKLWLADKIIGEPRATDSYTVDEMRAFGMVGVYASE